VKKTAWSFSALDMFEKCAKKFYHLKVAKDVKEPDNQWQADGKFVHEALFKRVTEGVPLPVQLRHMEGMAQRFADAPGEKHGEMRLALNDKFEPRDFFAKDVWVRAVLDLLIIRDGHAVLVDWKTGKRKDRFDQLKLSAAVLSRFMPEIESFKLAFVWLKDNEVSGMDIRKDELKQVWLDFMPRAAAIDEAKKTTNFPADPTPLCGYCPVTDCPHWINRDS
jgi:hypothetical protein